MTRCAQCLRVTSPDRIVAVRGLADAPGVSYLCRDCLDLVLRRGRLHPKQPTRVGDRLASIFEEEPTP